MSEQAINDNPPDFTEIIGDFMRYKWLIAVLSLLGFTLGFLYVLNAPKEYEAQALIMIQASKQNISADGRIMPYASEAVPAEAVLLSEIEVLRSEKLREELFTRLKLSQDQRFWQSRKKKTDPLQAEQEALRLLGSGLSIKPVGRSLVIEMRFRHANPEMAMLIINNLAQLYQQQQIEEKRHAAQQTSRWLQQRLDSLSKKVTLSARAVEEYQAREDLFDVSKAELTVQQLSEVSAQIIATAGKLATANAKKTQLAAITGQAQPAEDSADIAQSPLVNLLSHDEATLKATQAELQSRYGPNHPKIMAIQAELKGLQARKTIEIGHLKENLKNNVAALQAKITLLKTSLLELEQKRLRENQAAIGLRELQSNAEADRALYENFLARQKEVVLMAEIGQPDAKIVSYAHMPERPNRLSGLLLVLFCSFAGFILGLFLALIFNQIGDYLYSTAQLARITGSAAITSLPNTKEVETSAVQGLRIRLSTKLSIENKKIITVISALPDEGKTASILLLATSLAQSGAKVLVIDGNLRKPAFSNFTNNQAKPSVADVFINQTDIALSVIHERNSLDFLTGDPSEIIQINLLSPALIAAGMERLKPCYDFILIDTGSYLSAPESLLFHKLADCRLFVVRRNFTKAKIIRSVLAQMRQDHTSIDEFIFSHGTREI